MAFHQCRLANFLSRGKHLLCDWLKINVEILEKKDLEVFSYVLRVILGKIVEYAVRARNSPDKSHNGPLMELSTPITEQEYKDAINIVRDEI